MSANSLASQDFSTEIVLLISSNPVAVMGAWKPSVRKTYMNQLDLWLVYLALNFFLAGFEVPPRIGIHVE